MARYEGTFKSIEENYPTVHLWGDWYLVRQYTYEARQFSFWLLVNCMDFMEEPAPKNRKYKVITLCGSTKFKKEFIEVQKQLTLQGNVVISVGLFGHSGDCEAFAKSTKEMLDDMHKQKIDMADEIFVVDVDEYVGESTLAEIKYAKSQGKYIGYWSKSQFGKTAGEEKD